MGCRESYIKEEKKIVLYFLQLCKIELKILDKQDEKIYSISNYDQIDNYISKNSKNNFKKLEKKQNVRLNFINEVNKTIFYSEEKEKDE